MAEWRKIWANGLPNEGRSPKSGHRMIAEGMQFSWRWNGGTISLNLGVIWEMSVKRNAAPLKASRETWGMGEPRDKNSTVND